MTDIKYIADKDVDPVMDRKIRDLLTACFVDQPLFAKQRFYHEVPPHRWYIEDGERLIAHTALHEKTVTVDGNEVKIGGIAEVAVHPEARGRGYVRLLLTEAHDWLKKHGFMYSMLFGDTRVYTSSGYQPLDCSFHYYKPDKKKWTDEPIDSAMVAALSDKEWPEGNVDIKGPMF